MAERRDEDAPAQAEERAPVQRRVAMPDHATIQQLRAALQPIDEDPPGPNASTDPEDPAEHYFVAADGETKINAYGEKKGSAEDKRRMAALGFA